MTPLHAVASLLLLFTAAAALPQQEEMPADGHGLVVGAACPNLSGKGCSVCVAATDSRKGSKWGGQPCVHLSKAVRGEDCQPASWWEGSKHPGITATGNCTGCTRTCSGPPGPPSPPAPPAPPAPPHPSPRPKPASCNNELSAPPPPPTALVSAADQAGEAVSDSTGIGKLIKLPQPKGEESTYPAALDGSPFGFYFSGSNASTKWTINIQGGGWCYDEKDCLCRAKGSLGTSNVATPSKRLGCSNPLPDGSVDRDCNSVDLLYLDGASFSGYRAAPWPVSGTNESLWFRGIKNLDATIDWLFEQGGLGGATEVLLKGESAGGLSTFLHADRVGSRLKVRERTTKTRPCPLFSHFKQVFVCSSVPSLSYQKRAQRDRNDEKCSQF
jgi:hypothetical protein